MFPLKKTYQMNTDEANAALQNVFAACNTSPNTVPFDKLLLQQTARTKSFDILLKIILILLLITFLLPLTFTGFGPPANSSPIVLKAQNIDNNKIYLTFDFGNHTIKFEEAYLVSPGGTIYEIVSYDVQTQTLCFSYIAPNSSICIPYDENQLLHIQLDVQ